MRFVIISILSFYLAFSVLGQETYPFDHNGVTREYILYKPDILPAQAPLVFVLHGYTSTAEVRMKNSGMNTIAEKNRFAVCYPQGLSDNSNLTHWNARLTISSIDDIGFLSELAKYLHKQHNLNPQHTFVCGMSNGGFMSYTLACEAPEIFRAIASVTGIMSGYTWENCNPSQPVSVLHIHGIDDKIVPMDGSMSPVGGWGGAPHLDKIIAYWAEKNECAKVDSTHFPPSTQAFYHRKGINVHEVWYHKISNWGHKWPQANDNTGTIASELIWQFFSLYLANTPLVHEKMKPQRRQKIRISHYPTQVKPSLIIERKSCGPVKYTMTAMNGTVVLSGILRNGKAKIDLPGLAKGAYIFYFKRRLFFQAEKIVISYME